MPRIDDEQLRAIIGTHSTAGALHQMARELLAYRESGALEALKAAHDRLSDGMDDASMEIAERVHAAATKLEAIQKLANLSA